MMDPGRPGDTTFGGTARTLQTALWPAGSISSELSLLHRQGLAGWQEDVCWWCAKAAQTWREGDVLIEPRSMRV